MYALIARTHARKHRVADAMLRQAANEGRRRYAVLLSRGGK